MAERPAQRVALMSIHPEYANAILDGSKRIEFRKRRLAADIRTVLIYATSPVRRILGHFTVAEMVSTTPEHLWREFGEHGGISESLFHEYYTGADRAVGLVVDEAHRLPTALPLDHISPDITAPQSFAYLDASRLRHLMPSLS